ncbi:MAG: Na(+)-translocating NADH-quinone reductase subunit C [bacterium]|nr:Na(+)-translocating NADH-quinone reductase subunit C [bacterium]
MSSNDSLKNIIGVALVVCLVCSILVATAAVALRPRQEANKILEKRKNVLIAGALMKKGEDVNVDTIFSEKIQPALIDLKTGDQLPDEKMTGKLAPENFDVKKLSKDKDVGRVLPSKIDKARIKRMPTQMMVYFVKETDGYSRIIFPVHGSGLWSTMYGFLALDKDLKTVRGFTFYEHGETPGLGGEVDNPKWQASWNGKIAFDDAGKLKLAVIKGVAGPDSNDKIDGLSGATLTTRGVDDLIKFWFGPEGYGPYLEKLRKGKG